MTRRIVDISVPLQNDVPSDLGPGPKIVYIDHQQSLPTILPLFPGLAASDLPDGQGWAVEQVSLSTHNGTHLDADDRLDLQGDEIGGRIADRPRRGTSSFMRTRQFLDLRAQPCRVLNRPRAPANLHHHVVPGRHDLPGFAFGLVPVWRDVAIGPLKNDQGFARTIEAAPLPVGARHMGAQDAEL